jgi:hypothetical protein
MIMHPEFEKLPHFRILEVQAEDSLAYQGVFDSSLRLEDGRTGYLLSANGVVVEGKFYGFDALKMAAVFKPGVSTEAGPLEAGKSYAYLDAWWGWIVYLVLDESLEWERFRFTPQDVVEYSDGKTRIWGKIGQGPPHPDFVYQRTVKEGWDHEHCHICSGAIAEYAQQYGYRSTARELICEKCFLDYVQPRRISFINEVSASQIRGRQD